jgi:hypothetical protein
LLRMAYSPTARALPFHPDDFGTAPFLYKRSW